MAVAAARCCRNKAGWQLVRGREGAGRAVRCEGRVWGAITSMQLSTSTSRSRSRSTIQGRWSQAAGHADLQHACRTQRLQAAVVGLGVGGLEAHGCLGRDGGRANGGRVIGWVVRQGGWCVGG